MNKGIIFDIKEFSVNDGPGGRVTVFLKGCPLKCMWCHNPEGINMKPQYNNQTKKIVGTQWSVEELLLYMERYKKYFWTMHGGITFSGGEPTYQYDFLKECAQQLQEYHLLLDTSGYCEPEKFEKVAELFDMFYFDIKIADREKHIKYIGQPNDKIIENLKILNTMQKEVVIRMPMIPQITDTEENLNGIEDLITLYCQSDKIKIHLLPYNQLAGGKYPIYNMKYPLLNGFTKNNKKSIGEFCKNMEKKGYKVVNYV
mgnify:CR=1 FL=1